MAVGDAYVFPGFLTPVLTLLFFPKPPTTFLTCFCRGERRTYAGKKSRLNPGSNSQPPGYESDTLTTEPPGRGQNDIILLTEAWTYKDSDFNLPRYDANSFFRKVKHKRAKRNSGGIFIFIRDSFKDCVSIIRNHFDSIIWLKLDRHFFGFDEDCYLSSVYLWSYESSIRGTTDDDLFEILQNDIFDFDSHGKLFIICDFNARVSNKSD